MTFKSGIAPVLLLLLPLAGCDSSGTTGDNTGFPSRSEQEAAILASSGLQGSQAGIHSTELSAAEAAGLLFAREEEMLAYDVYTALFAKWGLPIFERIALGEAAHTAAVAQLIAHYNLVDPALDHVAGVFVDGGLQTFYDNLIATGSVSEIAALRAGALIEETDLRDLTMQLEQVVEHADIERVYENLLKGSRNHLREFVGVLETLGIVYEPQILDTATFLEIVQSSIEHGPWRGPND